MSEMSLKYVLNMARDMNSHNLSK